MPQTKQQLIAIPQRNTSDFELQALFFPFVKKWWLIVLLTLIGTGLGFKATPVYQTASNGLLERVKAHVVGYIVSNVPPSGSGAKFYGYHYIPSGSPEPKPFFQKKELTRD